MEMSRLERYAEYLRIPEFEMQKLRQPYATAPWEQARQEFEALLQERVEDVFNALEPGCSRQTVHALVVMAIMSTVSALRVANLPGADSVATRVKWKVSWIRNWHVCVITVDWREL